MSQAPRWAYLKLEDEAWIEAKRDELWRAVNPDPTCYIPERNPHITIVPAFEPGTMSATTAQTLLYKLEGEKVTLSGPKYYPSQDRIVTAYMEADISLEKPRDRLRRLLQKHGGDIVAETQDPHVTLFRAGSASDADEGDVQQPGVIKSVQEDIQTRVSEVVVE